MGDGRWYTTYGVLRMHDGGTWDYVGRYTVYIRMKNGALGVHVLLCGEVAVCIIISTARISRRRFAKLKEDSRPLLPSFLPTDDISSCGCVHDHV